MPLTRSSRRRPPAHRAGADRVVERPASCAPCARAGRRRSRRRARDRARGSRARAPAGARSRSTLPQPVEHALDVGRLAVEVVADRRLRGRVVRAQRHACRGSRGVSRQTPNEIPWATGSPSPSSTNITGAQWNWRSGASRSVARPPKPPDSATFEVSGPSPRSANACWCSGSAPRISETGSSVVQMPPICTWSWRFWPTAGLVDERLDLAHRQVLGGADPGEHQQLRRVVGAGAEDHLALGAQLRRLADAARRDADRARALEEHPVDVHVRLDGQVRPLGHRVQEGDGGRAAHAVALGHLVPADAVLRGAVEVVVAARARPRAPASTQASAIGLFERLSETGSGPPTPWHSDLAALVVLAALEVGEEVVLGPAGCRVAQPS